MKILEGSHGRMEGSHGRMERSHGRMEGITPQEPFLADSSGTQLIDLSLIA